MAKGVNKVILIGNLVPRPSCAAHIARLRERSRVPPAPDLRQSAPARAFDSTYSRLDRRSGDLPEACQQHPDSLAGDARGCPRRLGHDRKVYGRWIPEVDPLAGQKITALLAGESCDHPVTKPSPNRPTPAQPAPRPGKPLPAAEGLSVRGLGGVERSAQEESIGGAATFIVPVKSVT
jgi:hypothetical protein